MAEPSERSDAAPRGRKVPIQFTLHRRLRKRIAAPIPFSDRKPVDEFIDALPPERAIAIDNKIDLLNGLPDGASPCANLSHSLHNTRSAQANFRHFATPDPS